MLPSCVQMLNVYVEIMEFEPMKVHTLVITYGDPQTTPVIFVFSSEDRAQLGIEAWVRDWWVFEFKTPIPAYVTGKKLVEAYFERMGGAENFEIAECELDATSWGSPT